MLVKLAFSWASKYFSKSLRSSVMAEGRSGTACFPATSIKLRSSASSSSNTSRISRREASTSVKTPESTEERKKSEINTVRTILYNRNVQLDLEFKLE